MKPSGVYLRATVALLLLPLVVQVQGLKTKKKIKSKCGMARGPDRRAE